MCLSLAILEISNVLLHEARLLSSNHSGCSSTHAIGLAGADPCGFIAWIVLSQLAVGPLRYNLSLQIRSLQSIAHHHWVQLHWVLVEDFIWLRSQSSLIAHERGRQLSSSLTDFRLLVILGQEMLVVAIFDGANLVLHRLCGAQDAWSLLIRGTKELIGSSFAADWLGDWFLSSLWQFVELVSPLPCLQGFFERFKSLELRNLSLVQVFNALGSFLPNNLLVVGKEKTSELGTLEKVTSLILRLWLRQDLVSLEVARSCCTLTELQPKLVELIRVFGLFKLRIGRAVF
jgi:hypothetical protein